jgi:hypothetical protein
VVACTELAWIDDMTYGDALALPRGTQVRMADGRIGRIVSWQHSTESIVVRLDDDGPVTVRAAELQSTVDGWAAQLNLPKD